MILVLGWGGGVRRRWRWGGVIPTGSTRQACAPLFLLLDVPWWIWFWVQQVRACSPDPASCFLWSGNGLVCLEVSPPPAACHQPSSPYCLQRFFSLTGLVSGDIS